MEEMGHILPIAKIEQEDHLIYGIVLKCSKEFNEAGEPTDFQDTDGNWATADEIKKACHRFNLKLQRPAKSAGVDKGHNGKPDYGHVVESYIAKGELPDIQALPGDWIAVIQVTDEPTWAQILSHEITGLSIGGTAAIQPKKGD